MSSQRIASRLRPSRSGVAASIAAALSAIAVSSTPAAASSFDVIGVGPAGVAEINARAARADDGTAAFYNPGGLGLGHGYRVEVSPLLGVSALSVQSQRRPLEDPFGVAVALDATLPLKGPLEGRIRFGFSGYFLPSSVLRLIARPPQEPLFPYYDNRTQRLVLLMALGVRITDRLAIGGAVNVLGGVAGTADVHAGASGAPEPRLAVDATTRLAANVGVRFDPAPHVRIGLTYRQRFSVPAVVATTAEVGGVPIDIGITIREALFDPDTVVLGSSFDIGRATFELDASYAVWSSYAGPFVAVRAELPGVLVTEAPTIPLYRDVVGLRAAATYGLDLGPGVELTLRGGGGFEPSMLKSKQQGLTNIVDGHKALVGLGASLLLRDLFPKPVRIGLGSSVQVLSTFEQEKKPCAAHPCPADSVVGEDGANPGVGITNPGYPTLSAGGAFFSASLGLGVDL